MGVEQLYFIIGFLLGSILSCCALGIAFILWHEWYYKDPKQEE